MVFFAVAVHAAANDTQTVSSPDGKADIVIADGCLKTAPDRVVRGIYLVDHAAFKSILLGMSIPRYSRVCWNHQSNRVVIWDAPDNANTRLWLATRKAGQWLVTSVDFGSMLERAHPTTRTDNPRGYIDKAKWQREDCVTLSGAEDGTPWKAFINFTEANYTIDWK